MNNSYMIGIWAAIMAGIVFNVGLLIQKIALTKTNKLEKLLPQLIRNPLWIMGFILQFFMGSPLNMLAQIKIGPALIPGLMTTGLLVLTYGAVRFTGESFRFLDFVGVMLVIFSVAFIGLSGLNVDLKSSMQKNPEILWRLVLMNAAIIAISVFCHFAQKKFENTRSYIRIVNSGLLLSLSNLWLGILLIQCSLVFNGRVTATNIILLLVSSAMVMAGSMLGILETQRALLIGEVSKLIPMQYAPVQIIPVVSFYWVFMQQSPTKFALPLVGAGIFFVLVGALLLARYQNFEVKTTI